MFFGKNYVLSAKSTLPAQFHHSLKCNAYCPQSGGQKHYKHYSVLSKIPKVLLELRTAVISYN